MKGLLRAAHPAPTAAVSLFTTVAAIALGGDAGTVLAVFVATVSGQLAIGWTNDLIDADRDARAGRVDKPAAAGMVARTTLQRAWPISLFVCVVVSLLLGPLAAFAHLVGVACGLAHNVVTKGSVWSWAPYAVAFGLLPTFVTAAVLGEWAPWWATGAGAVLGVAAHLANAAPDIEVDLDHGLLGLPQRLGAVRSIQVSALLLLAGSVLAVWGPVAPTSGEGSLDDTSLELAPMELALRVAVVALVALIVGAVLIRIRRGGSLSQAFPAVLVVAGINVLLLIVGIARVE